MRLCETDADSRLERMSLHWRDKTEDFEIWLHFAAANWLDELAWKPYVLQY
jgi:hypothetical protein